MKTFRHVLLVLPLVAVSILGGAAAVLAARPPSAGTCALMVRFEPELNKFLAGCFGDCENGHECKKSTWGSPSGGKNGCRCGTTIADYMCTGVFGDNGSFQWVECQVTDDCISMGMECTTLDSEEWPQDGDWHYPCVCE